MKSDAEENEKHHFLKKVMVALRSTASVRLSFELTSNVRMTVGRIISPRHPDPQKRVTNICGNPTGPVQ